MIFGTAMRTVKHLAEALDRLTDQQYTVSCITLSGSSIGQHVRHVVEFFQCLLSGYDMGVVNYDSRHRNQKIATDIAYGQECLSAITDNISQADKPMALYAGFGGEGQSSILSTTYFRELFYNIEHTIHHMALIRIGIREVSETELPPEFGVAPSTLKYQAECAQ